MIPMFRVFSRGKLRGMFGPVGGGALAGEGLRWCLVRRTKKALAGPSATRLSDPNYAYVAPFFI
jgi:hypothetical protein